MPHAVMNPRPLVLGLAASLVVVTGVTGPVGVGSAATAGCTLVTTQATRASRLASDSADLGNTATQVQRCTGDPTSSQAVPTPAASPSRRPSVGKRRGGSTSTTSNSTISATTRGVPTVNPTFPVCVPVAGMSTNAAIATGSAIAGMSCTPAATATNPGNPAAQPPPMPNPEQVAYQAYAHLAVSAPTPHTAPPANTRTFVGFRTWLWIPARSWHAVTNTSTDGPVSTTVTATPVSVAWIMGDGVTEHCAGPGTPFVAGVTDPKATKPTCSHVYTHDSHNQPGDHYTVTVVVQYGATWTSNVGPSGQFPPVLLTTQVPLRVNQLQAVLD